MNKTTVLFTLEQVPTGEWHRQTACPHGALQATLYLAAFGWPVLDEVAAEAFATHQACFACECEPQLGTRELPPRPVHHIDIWPSEQYRLADELP